MSDPGSNDARRHPIVTVERGSAVLAQGPTDLPHEGKGLPVDMHGKLAIRVGEHQVVAGRPVPSMRRGQP